MPDSVYAVACNGATAPPVALSPAWVLDQLCRQIELTGKGSYHTARVNALGLAMRHLGLLVQDAPHPDAPKFDLSKLTDAQKLAVLTGLRLALGRSVPDIEAERTRPALPARLDEG
jgi:hypothetical protein